MPVKARSAKRLWHRLRAAGRPAVFSTAIKLRGAIAEDLGHPIQDRRRSAKRNSRLCRLLAEQGIDVVCATISMFHEVQRWNRAHIPGYFEIFLRVPMHEIERRDPKGIYARARQGKFENVVGIDIAAEEPEAPDLVIENYSTVDADAAVELIWKRSHGEEFRAPQKLTRIRFATRRRRWIDSGRG